MAKEQIAGVGVDVEGNPVVDPTKNVLDLVQGEVKRIDDIAALRDTHLKEIMDIITRHFRELSDKEASRLDSIRQVDVANQAAAAKAALDAIQALANTTTTTASALAKQVTELAASIATSTAASFGEISKRIAALELASAEGVGKGRVKDPQIDELVKVVNTLVQSRSENVGKGIGANALWGIILGAVGLVATVLAILSRFNN